MTSEQIEFLISQYADGTLGPAERATVEGMLQSDVAARQLLVEYRRIDAALGQQRIVPEIRWDRLAAHISTHISQSLDESDAPIVAGRIGMSRPRWRIAAAVLLAATGGLLAHRLRHLSQPQLRTEPVASSIVIGPAADVPQGPAVEEVTVGPSPAMAMHDADWRYGEGVVGRGNTNIVLLDAVPATAAPKSHLH